MAAYLLGDVLVCEDLKKALALWRQTRTDKTIVTLEGEVIDPHGVVTGGSRESAVAGILSQKREIRELEEVVARIESDLEAARARQVTLKQALADATALLEEIGTVHPAGRGGPGGRAEGRRSRPARAAEQLGQRRGQLAGRARRDRGASGPHRGAARRGPGGAGRPSAGRRSTPRRWAASCAPRPWP